MTLALHGKSRQRQWLLVVLGMMAIIGAVMAAVAMRGDARADHSTGDASTPVSGAGKVPIYVGHIGNLSCADLDGTYAIAGTTWSEVKFDSGNGTLFDGSVLAGPDGKTVTIDFTSASGAPFRFDWESEFGIDAVFVKQASNPGDSNIYIYQGLGADPGAEAFDDTGLGPAHNASAVSHISFCYDGNTPPPEPEDPTITKTYDDPIDDDSFSWTVEITNPNAFEIEVNLQDDGAELVLPNSICVVAVEGWDCKIPAGKTSIALYTPIGDHDVCQPFVNTAELNFNGKPVDLDSATAPPTGEECDTVTYQVCKAIDSDSDIGSGVFIIDIHGVQVEFPVEGTGKGNAVCDDVKFVNVGTEVNVSEVAVSGWEIPTYYLNGVLTPNSDGVGITVGPDSCDYNEEEDQQVEALVADAAPADVDCQVLIVNTFIAESEVTVAKTHSPVDPFEPGDPFTWTITVTVSGSQTSQPTSITDTIPPQFIAGTITADPPIDCSASSGNDIDCTLPAGAEVDSYDIDIAITVSPDLTGEQCTTYTNVVTITGPDVDGTQVGTTPDFTASASDGVIIECGEILEEGIITVIKYLDINGDGDANDPGEGPIAGWSISIDGVVSLTNASGETGANVTVGDTIPVSEATPAGYNVIGVRVNGGALQAGISALNVNIAGATTLVEFFNQPFGTINVNKTTLRIHNGVPIPQPQDRDGWTITVTSANCGVNDSTQTNAAGNASFTGLPLCTDYVVSENPVNPSSPGYSPSGPTSVNNVTPGGPTINFTNAITTFDPVCTNIADCAPVILNTPTPVPPTATPVPPTNTPTPVSTVAGEVTPGPSPTPQPPATGSGDGATLANGLNLMLVVAALIALSTGATLATAARRKR